MGFELQLKIAVDDEIVDYSKVLSNLDALRNQLADSPTVEGMMVVKVDAQEYGGDLTEPVLRLADQWVRKLSWVIGGDTETVALRNSEHCFAFIPTGDSVELSFFAGTESEIEEYVLEPTNVRLEAFATQSLDVCQNLLDMMGRANPDLLESDDDCRDLAISLDEAQKAWYKYQLHSKQRR